MLRSQLKVCGLGVGSVQVTEVVFCNVKDTRHANLLRSPTSQKVANLGVSTKQGKENSHKAGTGNLSL